MTASAAWLGFVLLLQERTAVINQFLQKSHEKKSPLAAMLSPDFEYEPFSMDEASFSMISPHCITAV